MRAAGPRRQRHVPLHRPPTHAAPGSYPDVWTVSKEAATASGAPIIDANQLDGYPTRTHGQAPDTFKVVDVHGKEVEVTASPPNLRLGENGGSASLFDAKVDGAVATIVEAKTWNGTTWIHTVGSGLGGGTVSGPPVDVLRSAGAAVAAEIGATGGGSVLGVTQQRIFAAQDSVEAPLTWHPDDLKNRGAHFRTVHVTRDSPPSDVGFAVGPVNHKNRPTDAGTFIADVDLSGFVCAATERIAPGETYLLDREGAGDVVLFIVRIELEDGSEVFVPFKRFHAVLPVERERRALVTTYGKTPLDSKQAREALVAVATVVQPAPAAPLASGGDEAQRVTFGEGGADGFWCGRTCGCCQKETSKMFVPREGAGPTLCPACVAAKDVMDKYERCLRDRCAECYSGYARFVDDSGRQLCGGCCDGRLGYYPKCEGDRCLTKGCGLMKDYVRMNVIGGGGFCWKCVPDKVEWRHRGQTHPDGSARYTGGARQRTFNDDDLTEIDELRLLGGKRALDDFMRRVAAGELSIGSWRYVQIVLTREYHFNVPRLILEDLDDIDADEWTALSRNKEQMWKDLTESLCEEFGGNDAYEDAQKRRRDEAKAAKAAKAPASKRRKASPKTGLEALTVAQLKAKCEAQKLKVGGTKGVLISRLEDAERGVYDWARGRNAVLAPAAPVRRGARGRAATDAETGGAPVQSATASPPAATLPEPVQDSPPAVAMESDPSTGDESTPPEVAPPEDDAIESVSAPGDDGADAASSDGDAYVPMSDDDDAAPAPPDDAAPVPPDDAAPAPRDEPMSEAGDAVPPLLDAAVLPIPGAFAECPGCAAGEHAQGRFEGHDDPVYGCLRAYQ